MELNVFASVNQAIDESVTERVCAKYGFRFELEKRERGTGETYLVSTIVGHPKLDAWKSPLPGDDKIFMIERVSGFWNWETAAPTVVLPTSPCWMNSW